jgi:multiple sugar transport system substrate-binding protein
MRRLIFVVLCVSLAVGAWASGGSEQSSSSTQMQGPATVTILSVTSPETNALKVSAAEFMKKNPNIKIVFNEQGRLGYFTNVTTQLVGGTDAFDLVQDNTTYMTELAAAGALEFWDKYLNDPKLTDLAAYNLADVPSRLQLKFKGQLFCIPTDLSSQIYYYRKDLISKPADTWDEMLALAKKYTRADNPSSPTKYGDLVTALTGGPEAPKIFYTVLWSFGGNAIDENGNVVINSEAAVKAAQVYRELRNYIPEDATTYNYPKVLDGLKAGTAAQAAVYWNAAWKDIHRSDSQYKDSYEIAMIPGAKQPDGSILRTPQTHGWGLVMNANSKNKVAAWKYLEFATSKEGMLIQGKNGGSPFRPSVIQELMQTDPANESYYRLMNKTYSAAHMEPLVPYYSKMHEILNRMVAAFLTTDQPIKDVLAKTEKDLKDLVKTYQ